MKLSPYNKKRNFSKTPEPKGKVSHKYKNLYIIQKHAATHLHYDFRLELNGVLLSWAVPKGPCLDPTVKRLAIHVEDHPVEYGHFEGIIPKGQYGGGTVMLWDEGKWIAEDDNPVEAYHKGHLRFSLVAEKLKGRWSLIRLKKTDEKSWFLIKAKDEYARPLSRYDVTQAEPNSVLTHYTLDEIAENANLMWTEKGQKKKLKPRTELANKKIAAKLSNIKIKLNSSSMPAEVFPQLATLVDKVPNGKNWLHEIKFDGYRILAFKKSNEVRLISRNHRDWTAHFANIVKAVHDLPIDNAILDGEIVLLDKEHRSNFQLLQNAIGEKGKHAFIYYIFDLLYFRNYNLMSLALIERKQILKELLTAKNYSLRYSDHIIGSGQEVLKRACEMGLEGIVSKQIESPYEEKRSKSWLKNKCKHRQEFVIGGYSPPQGARGYFGSLYLGYFDQQGRLKFCGNVGTGFSQRSLKSIYTQLQQYKTEKNPFESKPPGYTRAVWVKPTLIAEVEFSEWTHENILRHPSFKGLRSDKAVHSIKKETQMLLEKVNPLHLPFKLTNPNKLLYPENKITKLALANYYDQIQEWILPYVINRTLNPCNR